MATTRTSHITRIDIFTACIKTSADLAALVQRARVALEGDADLIDVAILTPGRYAIVRQQTARAHTGKSRYHIPEGHARVEFRSSRQRLERSLYDALLRSAVDHKVHFDRIDIQLDEPAEELPADVELAPDSAPSFL